MGWLHSKKSSEFLFLEESASYVEQKLSWLLRFIHNGTRRFVLHLPERSAFPENRGDPKQYILSLVEQIRAHIEYDGPLRIVVFNSKTSNWETWYESSEKDHYRFETIEIEDRLLEYKASLIRHIVLQLFTAKIAQYVNLDEKEWPYAELIAAWYGYSLILLSAEQEKPSHVFAAQPLLTPQQQLYAMTILCRYGNVDYLITKPYLNGTAYNFVDFYSKELRVDNRYLEFTSKCDLSIRLAPFQRIVLAEPPYSLKLIEAYGQLIRFDPSDEYYNNRGYAYLLNGQYELAIADFTACIEQNPYFAYAFNNRGYCKIMAGQIQEGMDDLDSSQMLDPDNGYYFRNLGISFLLHAEPEKALEQFKIALEMDPNIDHIHYWVGRAYFALSNLEKAQEHFTLSRSVPEMPQPQYPL